VLGVARALDVSDDEQGVAIPGLAGDLPPSFCVFKWGLGVGCPGCGMTRSIIAMAHVRVAQAYRLHRLGPVFFLVLLAQIPYRLYYIRTRRPGASDRVQRAFIRVAILLTVALVANWLMRLRGEIASR